MLHVWEGTCSPTLKNEWNVSQTDILIHFQVWESKCPFKYANKGSCSIIFGTWVRLRGFWLRTILKIILMNNDPKMVETRHIIWEPTLPQCSLTYALTKLETTHWPLQHHLFSFSFIFPFSSQSDLLCPSALHLSFVLASYHFLNWGVVHYLKFKWQLIKILKWIPPFLRGVQTKMKVKVFSSDNTSKMDVALWQVDRWDWMGLDGSLAGGK